jgi:hypothetical protein
MTKSIAAMKFSTEYEGHKYNLIHFRFFIQYAKIAGVEIEMVKPGDQVFIARDQLVFSCTVNDQQIIIDYADHSTRNWRDFYPNIPYFKFQTAETDARNFIPLGPPMVGLKRTGSKGATMREYNHVRYHYDYQPGSAVLCKQLPNGAATERRNRVQTLLKERFPDSDVLADCDQIDFWQAHERCLAAVCVPGATNNMVDRGHIELMGLGVCTVSPRLDTVFPKQQLLVPGKHYIRCQDDYSDLEEILVSLQKTPELCKEIGNQARQFYDEYYTPEKYWTWILENISS